MASDLNLNHTPVPDYAYLDDDNQEDVQMLFNLNEPAAGDMEEHVYLLDLNREPEEQGEYEQASFPGTSHHQSSFNAETEHQGVPNRSSHHQQSKKKLSSEERVQILLWLIHRAKEGELPRGTIKAASTEFNLSRRYISKIWNTAKEQMNANQRCNVTTKYHNCGRRRIQVPAAQIAELAMGDRTCIRDLADKVAIPKSTVHRMVKRGLIKPHTNALHPGLNVANKIKRMAWAISLLEGGTPETKQQYYTMFDFVHIDEKWFFLTKKTQRCYLAPNEKGKYRAAKSSKFIPKVMFTGVVARPRFNAAGECTFDGKIGIFSFTYQEAAKRSSKNRDKGTMVTKLVESINQKATREMLITQIIPAIKSKWPAHEGPKVIFIQQDNAPAHITQEDSEWQQVYKQDDFTFILIQQPPNSPDLNILDLGFFRSIQSLMHKKMPRNMDHMLEAVNLAFYELQPKTLENVWISLQHVMNEVLKNKGGNHYDLPHVGKKRLESQGNLQLQVKAPLWAVMQSWEYVYGNAELHEDEDATTNAANTQGATQVEEDSQYATTPGHALQETE